MGPIDRSFHVNADETEVFAEDISPSENSPTGSRRSDTPSSSLNKIEKESRDEKRDLKKILQARTKAQIADRIRMRQVLKRELAKVFYEQFAEIDTNEAVKTVDTNEVDLSGDLGDYYYYNYPEYADDEYYYYEYLD